MKRVLRGFLCLIVSTAFLAAVYRVWLGPIPWAALFGGGGTDAVSSASVILDAPSGAYLVLLNREAHRKMQTADDWIQFFEGESLVIMDDVTCLVGDADAGGRQMAESYRSRLPENQMTLKSEDATLLLSKAQAGRFDAIVMSKEFADAYRADTVFGLDGVAVIEIGGDAA